MLLKCDKVHSQEARSVEELRAGAGAAAPPRGRGAQEDSEEALRPKASKRGQERSGCMYVCMYPLVGSIGDSRWWV